jgi:hypothetical protein
LVQELRSRWVGLGALSEQNPEPFVTRDLDRVDTIAAQESRVWILFRSGTSATKAIPGAVIPGRNDRDRISVLEPLAHPIHGLLDL